MTQEKQGGHTPAPGRARPVRRWLGRLLLMALVLMALVLGGFAYLVATESGLRTLQGLIGRFAPADLVGLEGVEGRLIDRAVLKGLRLQLPTADIEIPRLHLDWRPGRLVRGELHIEELSLTDSHVELKPSDAPSEPLEALPEVHTPLRLQLQRLLLDGLTLVTAPDAEPVVLQSIELQAAMQDAQLRIERLDLVAETPAAEAGLSGQVALEAAYPLAAALNWRYTLPGGATIDGKASLDGDLERLNIRHDSQGALASRLEAEVADLLGNPAWRAKVEVDPFKLSDLDAAQPAIEAAARLTSEGALDAFRLEGSVDARVSAIEGLQDLGPLRGELAAELAAERLALTRLSVSAEGTEARIEGRGGMQLGGDQAGRFDAVIDWADLRWPLSGERRYASPQGSLQVAGTREAFTHQLEGRVEGRDLPEIAITGRGDGDADSLTFDSLLLNLLDGVLEARGRLAWTPQLAWRFDVAAENIDPGQQWAEMSGRLDAALHSEGGMVDDALDLRLDIERIGGVLQDRPVDGRGAVRLQDGVIRLDGLHLAAGPNRVEASGSIADALDLALALDAPELAVLHPQAQGAIKLDAQIAGRPERPQIDAQLSASGLGYGDIALASASGKAVLAADAQGPLDVDLRLQGLAAGGMNWDTATLKAQGRGEAHDFSLGLAGPALTLQSSGKGRWAADGAYGGQLAKLDLSHPELGAWRLGQAADFSVSAEGWQVAKTCLDSAANHGGLCVSSEGSDGANWKVRADSAKLAFDILAPYLPQDMALDGALRLTADLAAADNVLTGDARVEIGAGKVGVELDEGVQELDFSGAALDLKAKDSAITAALGLPLAGMGQLNGDLALDGWRLDAPARPDQPLRGSLKGRITDLTRLTAVVPQLADLKGRIDVDLKVDGTLSQARPGGSLRLDGAGFEVPAAGIRVSELTFRAISRGADTLAFDGSARIGDGVVQLGGESRFSAAAGLTSRVTLKGERLTVADVPEAKVVVTPDLALTLEPGRAEVSGEIFIPEALLKPRTLPEGSVSPSSDVVILDGEEGEEGLSLATAADVRLRLGDSVVFDGFGLRGHFRGNLRVTQEPGQLALGNGQLSIDDGSIITFGEELIIEQGRVLFANTPVSNPGISLVATRELSDAKVGARVSGTLRNRQLTFFSDPPMGQAEALNYLLTGGSSRGGSGGAQVVGGNLVVKEIGRRIGLDDVGVTQEDDSDNLSVYVGTYLTPQLYMQYISELGERSNKIRMRYDLTKRIQVEAETGDAQSADIFYTIER